jgi:predicted acetyltransferase
MEFSIVLVQRADWNLLKEIRLESLLLEGINFGSNYIKEQSYQECEWVNFIGERDKRAFFFLKNEAEIIGLTGIIRDQKDLEMGHLIASYIKAPYRRKGLSKLLFEARLNWARQNGLNNVAVSHRESNINSEKAIKNSGFGFTHSTEKYGRTTCLKRKFII